MDDSAHAHRRRRVRVRARRRRRATRPALPPTAAGRARSVGLGRRGILRVERWRLDRTPARRGRDLRTPRRHVHARGHFGCRDRPPAPPGRVGGHARRTAAGQRLQRHPQLGLRRRALVHRAGGLRRPGGVSTLRRCGARGGTRGRAGCGLQPPRPLGKLPARVRAVPARRAEHHVGIEHRPRPAGGARLHHRQCADVAR